MICDKVCLHLVLSSMVNLKEISLWKRSRYKLCMARTEKSVLETKSDDCTPAVDKNFHPSYCG